MIIYFYEKPNCQGNHQQKEILLSKGYQLVVYDILTYPWSYETLRPFFGDHPIESWFNLRTPKIKSGEIKPDSFINEEAAIEAMINDPYLIKRPLIGVGEQMAFGFNNSLVQSLLEKNPGEQLHLSEMENCQSDDGKWNC